MADITTNLIHHWKFDEASTPWTDSVGGIEASDAFVLGGAPAPVGTGVDFNGSTELDLDSSFAFSLSADFTFAAWLSLDVLGTYGIIGLDADGNNFWQVDEAFIRLRLDSLSSVLTYDAPFLVDTWHHIAVTRISDLCTVYVDGVAQADTKTNNRAVTVDRIGGYGSGTAQFNGLMDELRIYSRGLSGGEMAALAAFPGGSQPSQSLVNQIPFNPFGF